MSLPRARSARSDVGREVQGGADPRRGRHGGRRRGAAQLKILVAIKFLLPTFCRIKTQWRAAREARAAVRIKSEHVSRVSDVGTLDTGAPYMVMEYLEGTDLVSYLHARTKLSVEPCIRAAGVQPSPKRTNWASCIAISSRRTSFARGADGAISSKCSDFDFQEHRPDARTPVR